MNGSKRVENGTFYTVADAYLIFLRESGKPPRRMNMDLLTESLAYLDQVCEGERPPVDTAAELRAIRAQIGGVRVRRGKIPRGVILLAALLGAAILATSVAYALGIDVWSYIVKWNASVFSLQLTTDTREVASLQTQSGALNSYSVWGDAFEETLAEFDMRPELPKWIPSGYTLSHVKGYTLYEGVDRVLAEYTHEQGKTLVIRIGRNQNGYSEETTDHEKDENLIAVYNVCGMDVYIFDNLSRKTIVWTDAAYAVFLTGEFSVTEAKTIVLSMR